MDCDEYRSWVKRQLSTDWNVADGGPDDVMFSKYGANDAYLLMATCTRASRPVRIHTVVQGMPN